jgi:hypothetical protein
MSIFCLNILEVIVAKYIGDKLDIKNQNKIRPLTAVTLPILGDVC